MYIACILYKKGKTVTPPRAPPDHDPISSSAAVDSLDPCYPGAARARRPTSTGCQSARAPPRTGWGRRCRKHREGDAIRDPHQDHSDHVAGAPTSGYQQHLEAINKELIKVRKLICNPLSARIRVNRSLSLFSSGGGAAATSEPSHRPSDISPTSPTGNMLKGRPEYKYDSTSRTRTFS